MSKRNKSKPTGRVQSGRRKAMSPVVFASKANLSRLVASDIDAVLRSANASPIRIDWPTANGGSFTISYRYSPKLQCYIRSFYRTDRRHKLE